MYNLLIVDDMKSTADCLKEGINWELIGIKDVFCAYDAIMAKKVLENNRIDVMITDIRMPGKDGLELISSTIACYHEMKIILYSAYGSFEYAQKAIEYGARFFLCKPATYDEILDKVKTCITELEQNRREEKPYTNDKNLEKGNFIIRNAKVYMEENLNKNPTLSEIAEHIHVSQGYLSRLFKAEEGMTVVDYMVSRRISRSIELLQQPGVKISDIPEILGYESLSYFCRIFKKRPDTARKNI